MLNTVQLKDLPRGEFFKRKPNANKVYVRGEYFRPERKYSCDDWDDISRDILLRGSTIVYTEFTF